MNIVFWNCQGLRLKRKKPQNYLLENQIDILALNETYLNPKPKFHLPGYDIYKNKMPKLGIESVAHIGKDSTTTEASRKHY